MVVIANKYLKNRSESAVRAWVTRRNNGNDIPYNKGKKGLQVAWNIGLTKETDPRMMKISNSLKGNKNSAEADCSIEKRNKLRKHAIMQWESYEGRKKKIDSILNTIQSGRYTPQNNAFKGIGYREDLNHFFRSRWEANIARLFDYFGIIWQYEPNRFRLNNFVYIPDFYLPEFDKYVEISGFVREKKATKISIFNEKFPNKLIHIDGTEYTILDNIYSDLVPSWEKRG